MEDKDYIYIYDKDGRKEKMELVLSFEKDQNNYIVYKKIDKKTPLYMAKIEIDGEKTSIDINLSPEEQELVTQTIKGYFVEENNEV